MIMMFSSGKPICKERIQQIREEVLKEKSKFQISQEMNLHPTTVYEHTKDLFLLSQKVLRQILFRT